MLSTGMEAIIAPRFSNVVPGLKGDFALVRECFIA
jgi:hypothetical protein